MKSILCDRTDAPVLKAVGVKRSTRGFSFLELLVVIVIIALVASFLFPVFARAKKESLMADSISNMRQCYIALELYMQDSTSGKDLPSKSVAAGLLGLKITYDPADYWRKSANETSPFEAMIGSYAYSNSRVCFGANGPTSCAPIMFKQPEPVLLSIFYDPTKYQPAGYLDFTQPESFAPLPQKVLALWSDGHIKLRTVPRPSGAPGVGFTWSTLFVMLDQSQ